MSRGAVTWTTEPPSREDAKRELRLIQDEMVHKRMARADLTHEILELESDRKYLKAFLDFHAEKP